MAREPLSVVESAADHDAVDLDDEIRGRGSPRSGRAREGAIRNATRVIVHRVCSWCDREFAREYWLRPSDDEITTWGICTHCIELREGRGDAGRK